MQVLAGVGEGAPPEERPLADLVGGDLVGGWEPALGRAVRGDSAVCDGGAVRGGRWCRCGRAVEGQEVGGGPAPADLWFGEDGEVELESVVELGEHAADEPVRWSDPVPQHVDQGTVAGQGVDDGLLDRGDLLSPSPAGRGGDAEGGVDVRQGIGGSPTEGAADGQRCHQRRGLGEVDQPVQQPPLPGQLNRQRGQPRPAAGGAVRVLNSVHPVSIDRAWPVGWWIRRGRPGLRPVRRERRPG